ncbi:EutP/PduV family microcompartment system protein, partial [Marinobacter sp. 1Y8]
MDFYTVAGGISSAITIADKKKHISSFLIKIRKYIQSGRTNIIIFGAGGTGKTTLSKILTHQDIVDHKYNETATIEKIKIAQNVFGDYLVAPGQELRVEMHWPELFRKINKGEIAGIINVVSYGYHSIEIANSYKSTKYFNNESEESFIK